MDLSSPHGSSVNDGIDPDEFSMHYIHLDQIINMTAKHGPGALMAKFDVEAAYHNIAVHPDDRYLLGTKRCGQFFVDWPSHLASTLHLIFLIRWLIWWSGLKNWLCCLMSSFCFCDLTPHSASRLSPSVDGVPVERVTVYSGSGRAS